MRFRVALGWVALVILAWPLAVRAEGWSADGCGDEPAAPEYRLKSLEEYNAAVAQVNEYQRAARAYSACVLKQAHADEAAISRTAQNRIADIQTIAVGKQQEIYGRLASQAAAFKAAAGRLKGK